jgi:P4 family phage/plasmid primase-like protien
MAEHTEDRVRTFEKARSMVDRGYVEANFHTPGAYWQGRDYVTLNPTRNDHSLGSFRIRDDGVWYENVDGTHGDVFDLLEARDGIPALQAAQDLIGNRPVGYRAPPPPSPSSQPEADWKPIPPGALPTFRDQPSNITIYPSPENEDMFMVIRHDRPDGKKEIMPAFWDGSRFVKGLPPSLKGEKGYRPLARFLPDATVIVVEGEKKCAMAIAHLKGQYSVTCWHGGAGAAGIVRLDTLYGKDVILWPDNDDPGREAMEKIAMGLKGRAQVRMVQVPNGMPKAWDIGDAIQEGRSVEVLLESSVPFEYGPLDEMEQEIPLDLPNRPYTDMGNGERFIDRHGNRLRFSIEKNAWLVWNRKSWTDTDPSMITPMVKETIRSLPEPGNGESLEWARKCESSGSVNAMLTMASREPGIPVHEDEFDPDPFLFNCDNGIVDLRTGMLISHDRMALCSKVSPVAYNKDAGCPRFMDFLEDITQGRMDIVDFLQRWFGYSMTSDVSAQTFSIFYGNGANGKSTLVELVARIMGGYGKAAPPDVFIQKQQSGIPNDVAALRGARMVLTTETEANARLAESKMKSLTGGDKVSARYMRGEYFEFLPSWKVIISTNHRPRISGADYGIWRRIVLVPFDFVASGDKLDPQLPRKLWAEREGILKWMVDGARKWVDDGMGRAGLKVGKTLLDETQEYRTDEDVIGRFILEGCWKRGEGEIDITAHKIGSSDLLHCFARWCEREGEQYAAKMTQTAFGRAMRERGFEKVSMNGGRNGYRGIVPKLWDPRTNDFVDARRERDE